MAKPKPPGVTALLASAVNAVNTNVPFFATKAEMEKLTNYAAGSLVEFHPTYTDPGPPPNPDRFAFRATALGMQLHASGAPLTGKAPAAPPPPAPTGWAPPPSDPSGGAPAAAPAPSAPSAPVAPSVKFESGIPMPAARRGGRGQNSYGFEQMDVGISFFIPKSDSNPNPAKRIASTVSSASKRLTPKQFVVRSVEGGARIWRTV